LLSEKKEHHQSNSSKKKNSWFKKKDQARRNDGLCPARKKQERGGTPRPTPNARLDDPKGEKTKGRGGRGGGGGPTATINFERWEKKSLTCAPPRIYLPTTEGKKGEKGEVTHLSKSI